MHPSIAVNVIHSVGWGAILLAATSSCSSESQPKADEVPTDGTSSPSNVPTDGSTGNPTSGPTTNPSGTNSAPTTAPTATPSGTAVPSGAGGNGGTPIPSGTGGNGGTPIPNGTAPNPTPDPTGGAGGSPSGAAGSASPDAPGSGGDQNVGGQSAAGGTSSGGSSPSEEEPISGPWPPSEQYTNPVLWEDLADLEIVRVDDVYYYTASNMHYSPGAPILRSWDLVNWEYLSHAIPVLDFAPKYDMSGGTGYVRGTWASTLGYRTSNSTFYWMGCIDFQSTHVFTAPAAEGPWQKHGTLPCYFDAGVLFDEDDTVYVAYGREEIRVAQLNANASAEVSNRAVFQTPSNIGVLEGARFYKIDGNYYIFLTRPPNGEFVLRSNNPFGPYEIRPLVDGLSSPIQGGGVPHQGGIVQTPGGKWYYMGFVDAYPGGRVPALAPITWGADGWPVLDLVNGDFGASYPYPDVPRPPRETKPRTGIETFSDTKLSPEWEWNHNPDNSRWSLQDGLRLQTATVTNDLYRARNTVTRRILGPRSIATIELRYDQMSDGDVAGLALLRDSSAWIGVVRDGTNTRVVRVDGLSMDSSNWTTASTGSEVASSPISGGTLWLRVSADIRPGTNREGVFSYSTDGVTFQTFGPAFRMTNDWQFFMGYRYALFNYATQSLGGAVTVRSFEVATP